MSRVIIRPASAIPTVDSVNGQTGTVVLDAGDVSAIPTTEKGAANGVATLGSDGRVVEENQLVFGYRSGGFFSSPYTSYANNGSVTAEGVLYGTPIVIHNSTRIDQITASVAVAQDAGRVVRLGIYKVEANSDKTLVVDAGVIDGTITGFQFINIDITLTKGIYFLCTVCQGGTGASGQLRCIQGFNSPYIDRQSTAIDSGAFVGYRLTLGVTGALPATISASVAALSFITLPYVAIRKM